MTPASTNDIQDYLNTVDGTKTGNLRLIDTDKIYCKTIDGLVQIRSLPPWKEKYNSLYGFCRTIFRYTDSNGTKREIFGTSKRLYEKTVNITPLSTSSTAIANSLNSVNLSPTMTVNAVAHGMIVGDRVKIGGAADFAGWTAATQINKEHIIVSVPTANSFTVTISSNATSTVNNGGGAGTVYYKQITMPADSDDEPVIWSMDLFGNDLILTPGGQSGVYIWQNDTAVAPTLLTNAPAAVNWVYVMNNAVHTLGSGGVPNRIKASDVGDATIWAIGPGSLAWESDIAGYETFISQVKVGGITDSLLFTGHRVGLLQYVGLPSIYEFRDVSESDGLIGPKAVTQIDGVPYWMGRFDFYSYAGGQVVTLPNNMLKRTIFDFGTPDAPKKCFVAPNPPLNHIMWFFAPNALVDFEPTAYVIYDYEEQHFTFGQMLGQRLAAENPFYGSEAVLNPFYMTRFTSADSVYPTSRIYEHGGTTDSASYYLGEPAGFARSYARTAYAQIGNGDNIMEIAEIVPDIGFENENSSRVATITVLTKDQPSNIEEFTYGPYSVTRATTLLDPMAPGRFRCYVFEAEASGTGATVQNYFYLPRIWESVQAGPPL